MSNRTKYLFWRASEVVSFLGSSVGFLVTLDGFQQQNYYRVAGAGAATVLSFTYSLFSAIRKARYQSKLGRKTKNSIILERPNSDRISFLVRRKSFGLEGLFDKLIEWVPWTGGLRNKFYAKSFPEDREPTNFLIYTNTADRRGNAYPFLGGERILEIVNVKSGNVESARREAMHRTYELAKASAKDMGEADKIPVLDLTGYSSTQTQA